MANLLLARGSQDQNVQVVLGAPVAERSERELGASRFAPLSTPTPRRSTSSPPSQPPTAPTRSATISIVNKPLVVARCPLLYRVQNTNAKPRIAITLLNACHTPIRFARVPAGIASQS